MCNTMLRYTFGVIVEVRGDKRNKFKYCYVIYLPVFYLMDSVVMLEIYWGTTQGKS
jgi:hypothetical protein